MLRRFALALLVVCPLYAAKRPLTHDDYDGWRHIQNQQLSNDGHYLAYAEFPEQGDGELVVRDLRTAKETRQPIGELPPPPPPNYTSPQAEEAPPAQPGIAIKFSADGRTLVVSTFPRRAEVQQAKREKRKPEDMPKGDVIVLDLASGAVFRASRVKSFELPEKSSDYVAYLQVPEKPRPGASGATKPAEAVSTASAAAARPKKTETGVVVLRQISTGTERSFSDVAEYILTKDGATLVYSVAADAAGRSGVYALKTGSTAEAAALLSGKGKYEKLAFDEAQTRLAFVSDHDDAASRQPKFKLYDWDLGTGTAMEAASPASDGFRAGWIISDKATIRFSKDGQRVFFGTAPEPAPEKAPDTTPADERVSVDLWSWKDDYIQPMQKVRAVVERARSYVAEYDLRTRKFTQLADLTMRELAPSENGRYATGGDDREYRRMQEYDERFEDAYVVNTETGERKLVLTKHSGRLVLSPDSKYAAYFNGKDWITVSVPDGKIANLTGKLSVSFGREENDQPSNPSAYGLAGWTNDGRYLLLYDRFDIWRSKPDGSEAVNLTTGLGRNEHTAFRLVRFQYGEPSDKWIDPAKPLLLRAENERTRDSGFYRTSVEATGSPQKLVMAAKNFAVPVKARDAEVYVLAASTFSQYPDLLTTNGEFREFRKVSNANPQLATILWGTAELMHYKSADGVPLDGILYKPENFDPKKKYPLLVYIYERLTQGLNNFVEPRPSHNINVSYYVSNGYVVLEPDIAYRVGYPGQSALDCVMPAVQEAVDRGFVDEKAIGIQGHSWGGYQIAYMVTRTNRFRAAAAGAPVADMISAYDGIRWGPGIPRQFQYERTQSRIGGTIWEYPLRYIENSPIFAADRVKTPLLMIHNDADDAVPWYQGIEYYLALRRLNKEAYLFTYNGEPHGLRRRADQKDYTLRLQQFFDYYLKGAPEPEWMVHGIPYLDKDGVVISDSQ